MKLPMEVRVHTIPLTNRRMATLHAPLDLSERDLDQLERYMGILRDASAPLARDQALEHLARLLAGLDENCIENDLRIVLENFVREAR